MTVPVNVTYCKATAGCVVCGITDVTCAHVRGKKEMVREGVRDHGRMNLVPLCWNHHYVFYDKGNLLISMIGKWLVTARIQDGVCEVTIQERRLTVADKFLHWKNAQAIRQLRACWRSVKRVVGESLPLSHPVA